MVNGGLCGRVAAWEVGRQSESNSMKDLILPLSLSPTSKGRVEAPERRNARPWHTGNLCETGEVESSGASLACMKRFPSAYNPLSHLTSTLLCTLHIHADISICVRLPCAHLPLLYHVFHRGVHPKLAPGRRPPHKATALCRRRRVRPRQCRRARRFHFATRSG